MLKPPLKWAGGKRWLVPRLAELWKGNEDRRLVEPFCGGLAVALGLDVGSALLNDVNPYLINFYRHVQRGLVVNIHMANDETLYYQHRSRFNKLIEHGDRRTRGLASFFYYLNRTGFNGLCRFNRKGQFNVPFGSYKSINYKRDFLDYSQVFDRWEFSCVDFQDVETRQFDFLYSDPPYDGTFTGYSGNAFTWQDQVRLCGWLSSHPGPVVASNRATTRILDLYDERGFTIHRLAGPRRISCTGDRSPATEMLATRNL